jgi:hypothetical protein
VAHLVKQIFYSSFPFFFHLFRDYLGILRRWIAAINTKGQIFKLFDFSCKINMDASPPETLRLCLFGGKSRKDT